MAAADRADSAAERLLIRLLRSAGVAGWVPAHPFGPWTIDLAFPADRVAVEVDGWAWHVDVELFRADRRKGNALVARLEPGAVHLARPGRRTGPGADAEPRSRPPMIVGIVTTAPPTGGAVTVPTITPGHGVAAGVPA